MDQTGSAPTDLDDCRLTAVGLLFEVSQAIEGLLAPQLAEFGLSGVEMGVLIRLARTPDNRLRMSDLALQCDLSASGLTRVVDRLEKSGDVRRDACVGDRRVTYAVLTQAGMHRVTSMLPGHVAQVEEVFTGLLEPAELAAMLDALRTIRDSIRPGSTAGAEGHAEDDLANRSTPASA